MRKTLYSGCKRSFTTVNGSIMHKERQKEDQGDADGIAPPAPCRPVPDADARHGLLRRAEVRVRRRFGAGRIRAKATNRRFLINRSTSSENGRG